MRDMTRSETARDIAARLRLRQQGRSWRGDCPACGYRGTFSLTEREGRSVWWCASCQNGAAIARALGFEHGGSAAAKRANVANPHRRNDGGSDHRDAARRLWDKAGPIAGTTAERYLAARGLTGGDSPALRFLPNELHRPSNTRWPVLIAAITAPTSGALLAVHRTFLARDGSGKAPVDPPKMTLGPFAGGVIRLAEPEPEKRLALAEGVETALAASTILNAPAWAAIAAGNLHKIALPETVLDVILAADPDETGQREAERAALRWQAEGRRVRIATPDGDGDFNDLLLRRRAARGASHAG